MKKLTTLLGCGLTALVIGCGDGGGKPSGGVAAPTVMDPAYMEKMQKSADPALQEAANAAKETGDTIKDAAKDATEAVKETTKDAVDAAKEAVKDAKDAIKEGADAVKESVKEATKEEGDAAKENSK